MRMSELIAKIRDGVALTDEEVAFWWRTTRRAGSRIIRCPPC
jgi:hypothetical protein